MRYRLVTTALESTWSKNSPPILFLGEWCTIFRRKYMWSSIENKVVNYHWDNREKLRLDYDNIKHFYQKSLVALSAKLNEIHGVKKSNRYWQILVGPWLSYFVQIAFDRWFMIRYALNNYDVVETIVLKKDPGDGVPNDMQAFVTAMSDDAWNEILFGQILKYERAPIIYKEDGANQQLAIHGGECGSSLSYALRIWFNSLINFLSIRLVGREDYFFLSTYLGLFQNIYLQIKLGQFPGLWKTSSLPQYVYSATLRNWRLSLSKSQPTETESEQFLELLSELIPRHLPLAYLEGYTSLDKICAKLRWPKNPKLIFTSNSYSNDDLFKVWAADKVESGIPLVIGQHGGNYGISLFEFTEEHQIAVADWFLSWGWTDPSSQKVVPVGNFRAIKSSRPNKAGMALLVGLSIPRFSYRLFSIPISSSQWNNYFNEQVRFVNSLPENIKHNLLVRLYSNDYDNCQEMRWQEYFPELHINLGKDPVSKLLKQSRICISTYNATTYLETLALNFPTLIFWNPYYSEIRNGAKKNLKILEDVGIFHDTPESAANHLAAIWHDVQGWWWRSDVQEARKLFCEIYMNSESPIDKLERTLKVIAKKEPGPLFWT